ncbi:7-carboxy-7-deazaguanine synthase [Lamprobacter modestohalophilus]|uniref:7-carboxy-7-deazaguanine synthase n=1 Tax=Lamprobacter modestohalophilus TaxID=1064514 RepID=UPI002ADEC0E7|nr:7-carboxy-7-deazaguanine synthase [Lamprobacter modestohalophilus]MEA1051998.1 7-carboxy-7-deazaguanine synthase [Lamprobacter modestohalophilus]
MPSSYQIKEVFYTLQGEGARSGRAAVFCRFSGCNLWSGLERDRAGAICTFCDTDFRGTDGPGGGRFNGAEALAEHILAQWIGQSASGDGSRGRRYVVCTGGEPLLQLDAALIAALHERDFEIAVETNGTQPAPPGIDWLCVSPKADAPLALRSGDELKLVFPQPDAPPERFADLDFAQFFLQPMDGPQRAKYTDWAVDYCRRHPQWRLSLQLHKLLGIP